MFCNALWTDANNERRNQGYHCTYLPPTEKQIMDEGVSLMLGEVDFIDYWWAFF